MKKLLILLLLFCCGCQGDTGIWWIDVPRQRAEYERKVGWSTGFYAYTCEHGHRHSVESFSNGRKSYYCHGRDCDRCCMK